MKFSSTLFATVLVTFTLSFAANACEQECRTGISLAFGDNYAVEVKKLDETLKSNLEKNLFTGFNGEISSSTRSACNKAINDEVDSFEKSFISTFAKLIEDSIFNQSPQFKGQCQHPLRVNQPPAGVAWTMKDCERQDYICGNPPAVCHYMDQYVKPRNVKNVKESLAERLSSKGSFSKSLTAAVIKAAQSTMKASDLSSFTELAKKNINDQLNIYIEYFNKEFCEGTTCDKYDHDIKVKLLSYP